MREFSEDEDLMLVGLDRGGLVNLGFSPMVLFPELSDCKFSVSFVCCDPSGAPSSPTLEVPQAS